MERTTQRRIKLLELSVAGSLAKEILVPDVTQGPRRGRGWGGFSPPSPPPPHFFTVKGKNKKNLSKAFLEESK